MDIATNLVALAALKAALGGLIVDNGGTPPSYFPDYVQAIQRAGTFWNRAETITVEGRRISKRALLTWDGKHENWVASRNLVFPDLTEIPADCFKGLSVETVIAPNVTNVGARAFKGCYHLKRVVLSPDLSIIGDEAFRCCIGCDFADLDFGRVKRIGKSAFRSSGIVRTFASATNVTAHVGEYAFRRSRLDDNFFPNNAIAGNGAYSYTPLSGSVGTEYMEGGIDGTHGYAGTRITSYKGFCNTSECLNCRNLRTAFLCSSTIGGECFKGCVALATVLNAEEVDAIGNGAFAGCKAIEALSFPTADEIGPGAFLGCTNLASLAIPDVRTLYPLFVPLYFYLAPETQADMDAYRVKKNGTLMTFPVLSRLTQLSLPAVEEIKPFAFGLSPTEPLTGIVDLYLPNKTVAQIKAMTGYSLWNLSTNCTIHASNGSFRYREE